jgi:Zn-finger nucleic acid-binding protein
MASAQTLNCPTCGASIDSDSTLCRYCGTRLATIACGKCFGMMFVGSKFCPHCGARAEKVVEVGPALPCPECNVVMQQITIKNTPLQECPQCYGLWVDAVSFDQICADRERQADLLNSELPKPRIYPSPVRYRPCPACGELMNRFNFAHRSGVIIDKCAEHGVWFDRDELQRVVDFLHAGGMQLSRQQEWEERIKRMQQTAGENRYDAAVESISSQDDPSVSGVMRLISEVLRSKVG